MWEFEAHLCHTWHLTECLWVWKSCSRTKWKAIGFFGREEHEPYKTYHSSTSPLWHQYVNVVLYLASDETVWTTVWCVFGRRTVSQSQGRALMWPASGPELWGREMSMLLTGRRCGSPMVGKLTGVYSLPLVLLLYSFQFMLVQLNDRFVRLQFVALLNQL